MVVDYATAYAALSPPSNDPGMTSRELSALWGSKATATKERIRTLLNSGKLKLGWRKIERIDGLTTTVPVYKIVK